MSDVFVKQGDWEIALNDTMGKISIEDHGAGGFVCLDDGVHWAAVRLDGIRLEGVSDEPSFDAVIARVLVMAILKAKVFISVSIAPE